MDKTELVVGEWIEVAQEDFDAASKLAEVPYPAPACYHCQQAVEKILKAYFIVKENRLTKTHDLNELIDTCAKHSPDFGNFKEACSDITLFTAVRYPPIRKIRLLTIHEMKQTLEHTREILDFTKSKLKELGY
jgi:HEPN domain-containing protein